MINRCSLSVGFLLTFILNIPLATAQDIQKYQVFKLENKIGTEVVTPLNGAEGNTVQININTQDRGTKLALAATLTSSNAGLKFVSSGHTSRFKKEVLDTLIKPGSSFPLSQNGSIKMREMLISSWIKSGMPKAVRSALDESHIIIKEINQQTGVLKDKGLRAFLIHHGLDEVFWTDAEGKSVFLTTTDSEGDKRAVIAQANLPDFTLLNQQSTKYLLQAYIDNIDSIAKSYKAIAILGGHIIDLIRNGELQKNTLVLIINGKIEYAGAINNSLIPKGAKVIDATDKYLIPGLWDMHAHVFHPAYLQKALRSGVTSVRDMGNEFDFLVQMKNMLNTGSIPAPNLYAAGLLDGKSSTTLGIRMATNTAEIKKNIQQYHDAGFSQIKVYSSVRKNDFNTIVAEAQRYNMQVVGHLPQGYTLGYFINNGMNSLSHIHYVMNSLKRTGDFKTANKDLLDAMLAKKIYLDPTLNVYRLTGDKRLPTLGRMVKLLSDYGIPIVAGTDNEGTITDEIESYVNLGISPLNAISAATIVPARVMGAEKESGSIEKGKNGDLLILHENPLLNISTLKNIHTIIKGHFIIPI